MVHLHFTDDSPPFPNAWLAPPTSAKGIYYDPLQDRAEFERGPRLLREELAKYPIALLEKSLKDIYVFKYLSKQNTVVGGFSWTQAKRLYLLDDSNPDPVAEGYLRLTMHHELAHLLLAENPSHFSRSDWQSLNPPTFPYGKGGLDTIRNGRSGVTQLEPTWWEKGFGRPYGVSSLDEDFATLCEALFSGDPRFWKAVDRVDLLNKKVKMLIDFYHSLDETMTESYFRQITPTMKWATIPRFNYSAGDTVYFANGGKIVSAGNPPTVTEYPPGSFAIFADKDVVTWYPPGQKHPR